MTENSDSEANRVEIVQKENYLHYRDGDELVRVNTSEKSEQGDE